MRPIQLDNVTKELVKMQQKLQQCLPGITVHSRQLTKPVYPRQKSQLIEEDVNSKMNSLQNT